MISLIKDLRENVHNGDNWHKAIIDCIVLWVAKEEFYRGYKYSYWIDNEAFDWITLTERLVSAIKSYIPKKDYYNVTFTGLLPSIESYSYLKTKISKPKLSQMRNYYYGIIIENFIYHYKLIQYQKNTLDYIKQEESFYEDIYGEKLNLLYDQFISQTRITNRHRLNIHEYKQFCYWLFKYRIKNSDKAKMANETNLALHNAQKSLDRRILILFE
jgi:hypothetical protein